jgi:hypothetical protein
MWQREEGSSIRHSQLTSSSFKLFLYFLLISAKEHVKMSEQVRTIFLPVVTAVCLVEFLRCENRIGTLISYRTERRNIHPFLPEHNFSWRHPPDGAPIPSRHIIVSQ